MLPNLLPGCSGQGHVVSPKPTVPDLRDGLPSHCPAQEAEALAMSIFPLQVAPAATQTLVGAFPPSFLGQFELGPRGREADDMGPLQCAPGEGHSRGSPGSRDGQRRGSRGCGRQASLARGSIPVLGLLSRLTLTSRGNEKFSPNRFQRSDIPSFDFLS